MQNLYISGLRWSQCVSKGKNRLYWTDIQVPPICIEVWSNLTLGAATPASFWLTLFLLQVLIHIERFAFVSFYISVRTFQTLSVRSQYFLNLASLRRLLSPLLGYFALPLAAVVSTECILGGWYRQRCFTMICYLDLILRYMSDSL